MQFTDQLNRKISLGKTPKRIISLVPSQTELLVDLGLENEIVGLTKFCIHPSSLKQQKTIVGGTKSINTDVIHELKPDIILCNKEENTKEIVELCEQIAPVHVSDIFTIDDALELTEQYGALFNKTAEASNIIEEINYKLTDFKTFIKQYPPKKVAYFIWRKPWMVAGNDTFINHLLTLNNFKNIYDTKNRYPEVTIDTILNDKPDLVLLSSEPYPFKEKHLLEIKSIAPSLTPLLVDGEMFSWYGSRLLYAFDYFKGLHKKMA